MNPSPKSSYPADEAATRGPLDVPRNNAMIRILIADDHAIVRNGLRQIMSGTPDIVVAGEATNGDEVLALAKSASFDLLLLDMSMPGTGLSGIDLICKLLAGDAQPKILVLSMHNESHMVSRALKAGVRGYITKDSDQDVLIAAIRKIAVGGRFIDPSLVDELVFHGGDSVALPHETLSDREFQVLKMLAEGKTLTSIAQTLHLSDKTITTYKSRLMQKLGVHTTANLLSYAIRHGLATGLPPSPPAPKAE